MANVQIYTTETCGYCHLAKEWFTKNGVEYTEVNVGMGADPVKRTEMVQKSGQMGVPVIDIDGQIVIGFNKPKLAQILNIAA
jgi:glutaredoxin 3